MDEPSIKLTNLDLLPNSGAHILTIIEGTEAYELRFDRRAAVGLRDFFVAGEMSPDYIARLRPTLDVDPWNYGFAVLHRADGLVIGMASFKGPPTADGTVEIAYAIVPGYQNRGYATEAAQALVDFSLSDSRVRQIIAHTLREPNASTRVLKKCGFQQVGEVIDPEDGSVWRWQR